MIGSTKQVEWALKIRAEQIECLSETLGERPADPRRVGVWLQRAGERALAARLWANPLADALALAETMTDAGWWIDARRNTIFAPLAAEALQAELDPIRTALIARGRRADGFAEGLINDLAAEAKRPLTAETVAAYVQGATNLDAETCAAVAATLVARLGG